MAGEKHLLVEASGVYTNAHLTEEIWAVTVRCALVFGTVDEAGTLPSNWNPVAANVNRTETDWKITGNWGISGGPGLTFSPDDYLDGQVAPAFRTWIAAGAMSSLVQLTSCKVYPIGSPTGRAVPAPPYSQGTPIVLDWTQNFPVGTGTSGVFPPQIALVASHTTPQPGRRGRGRMFLPGLAISTDDTGQIKTGSQTTVLDAQIALLEALSVDGGVDPANFSLRPIVTGKPYVNYGMITGVNVGNRYDTQRRRRNQLTETRISGSPSY